MRQNGSPGPVFESDEDRTWFLVRLPVHERVTPAATEHETEHETEHVERLISVLRGEMNRPQLQEMLGISRRPHFVAVYLGPALKAGLIEMTLPGKPRSRKQSYRRTAAGEALAQEIGEGDHSA